MKSLTTRTTRGTASVGRPDLHVSLAGLAALAVSNGLGRFAFTPMLPLMQAEHGLSLGEGSWLAAAN